MTTAALFDVLVIGSGAAGLATALAAAPRRVAVLTPGPVPALDGASRWAQGGIAAALAADDSPQLHAEDTLAAGAGLSDPEAVARLTAAAPELIAWLQTLGARFDRAGVALTLGREAAHRRARIVHAQGDATGAEVMRALSVAAATRSHLTLVTRRSAYALARDDGGRVVGVWAQGPDGSELWRARAVVLASGGYAGLYRYTTNPSGSDGSGIALALAAGAMLADLEFVQFHPTALAPRDGAHGQLPLLTEALRGAGAVLLDARGKRFMPVLHADAELAPRDVVARAVWREAHRGGAWLDARAAVGAGFPQRFPTVFAACMARGLDPRMQAIPVVPAAHYCMGGVRIDGAGATSLPGLYAVGEAARSGVHGANRLASNSLLEGLAQGRALGAALASQSLPGPGAALPASRFWHPLSAALRARLGDLLWRDAAVQRSGDGLVRAEAVLTQLAAETPAASSGHDVLALTAAMLAAMRARHRSIGAHFRVDAMVVPERSRAAIC
ncbi:MAG: L-aspartate oxidase [Xanthomonadaceae bacterium]|nr:L-aspartate oxidase [Xanthomonadaceae bacterium]